MLRWGREDWAEGGTLAAGRPDSSRADSEPAFRPHLQAAREDGTQIPGFSSSPGGTALMGIPPNWRGRSIEARPPGQQLTP